MRLERARQGVKLFTREEIQRMLKEAGLQLRAMILLGINAGLGNADCGNLRLRHLDLETGHTFRTIADEAKDQPAVDLVMGHESSHMSSQYRQTIARERLQAVADYIHQWLFGEPAMNDGQDEEKPAVVKFPAAEVG